MRARLRSLFPEPWWLSVLSIAVFGLFAVVLTLSFFSPVYYDDIRYPMSTARAGYDGWLALSTIPYCTSTLLTPYPFTLLPGRWFSWVIHALSDNFLIMRFFNMSLFGGWLAYMCWLVRKVFLPQWHWLFAYALVAAYMSLGLVPFMMMLNRSDVGMMACITFFASLPFVLRQHTLRPSRQYGLVLLLWLIASWFFSSHLKAALYAPVLLVACAYLPLRGRWLRVALYAGLLLIVLQSLHFWQGKLSCPDDKREQELRSSQALSFDSMIVGIEDVTDDMLNKHSLLAKRFSSAAYDLDRNDVPVSQRILDYLMMIFAFGMILFPFLFVLVERLLVNLLNSFVYINRLFFIVPNKWRLPFEETAWASFLDAMLSVLGILIAVMLIKGLVWQLRHRKVKEFLAPECSLLFAIAAGLLLQTLLQIAKNFYETAFVWPCLLVMMMLLCMQKPWQAYVQQKWRFILLGLFTLSILSQLELLSTFGVSTVKALQTEDSNGVLYDNVLTSPLHYGRTAKHVDEAAASCGIKTDASSKHVLVDTVTYLALKHTSQPFLYRMEFGKRVDSTDKIFRLLQRFDSSGVIMLCPHIPPELRDKGKEVEGICCLSHDAVTDVPLADMPPPEANPE